jgi:GNAT superfamily N-acetyltransferase
MVPDLERLFTETIMDTFRKNGIDSPAELGHEIEEKVALVRTALNSPGHGHFLVALTQGRPVGIAGTFPVCRVIRDHLPDLPEDQVELGAVYVHPSFQNQGIAQALVGRLVALLAQRQVDTFVLDCGYRTSQAFWRRLFGDPSVSFPSFFGDDQAYEIWQVSTDWALYRLVSKSS